MSLMGRQAYLEEQQGLAEEDETSDLLKNVPQGVAFSRLTFPPTGSEIILCGVKRRALLHSSYINDLLLEMQPECTLL